MVVDEGIVPTTDDPTLNALIRIYIAEARPPMKRLYGHNLDDDIREAYRSHVQDAEHGDPPDDHDLIPLFRAEVQRCAAEGKRDSFASVVKRAQRYHERNDPIDDDTDDNTTNDGNGGNPTTTAMKFGLAEWIVEDDARRAAIMAAAKRRLADRDAVID